MYERKSKEEYFKCFEGKLIQKPKKKNLKEKLKKLNSLFFHLIFCPNFRTRQRHGPMKSNKWNSICMQMVALILFQLSTNPYQSFKFFSYKKTLNHVHRLHNSFPLHVSLVTSMLHLFASTLISLNTQNRWQPRTIW